MKRTLLLLIVIISIALLSGCVSAQLSYTLTDDGTANVHYLISFDEQEENISGYLREVGSYWAEQGLSIYADVEAGTLSGEKTIASETAVQAAEEFSKLLQDETLFTDVSFQYSPAFETDLYSFEAKISLVDIIRQREAQDIPPDQVEAMEKAATDNSYTLSVTLPGNVVSTNADVQNANTCTWHLEYGEITHISMQTERLNTEKLEKRDQLENRQELDNLLMIVFAVVAALSVLAIILTMIIRRVLRKRASEVRVKHFR